MLIRTLYHLVIYYASLAFFAVGGLEVAAVALFGGLFPTTDRSQRFFQRFIHRHFAVFHWWGEVARVMFVRYHGMENWPRGGVVVVANHPAMIDITCLLARIPEAICIFKPAIRRNPVLGAARRAGYIASDGGHELVHEAAVKVAAGHQLIVFPEGTRTPPDVPLLPFRPGFVLIARRGHVPIQLVRITTNSDLLTKGRAWWKLPVMPVRVDVTVGPLLPSDTEASNVEASAAIEAWFRSGAPAQPGAAAVAQGKS